MANWTSKQREMFSRQRGNRISLLYRWFLECPVCENEVEFETLFELLPGVDPVVPVYCETCNETYDAGFEDPG